MAKKTIIDLDISQSATSPLVMLQTSGEKCIAWGCLLQFTQKILHLQEYAHWVSESHMPTTNIAWFACYTF